MQQNRHIKNGDSLLRPRRAEILYRAAETIVREKENLARDMTREMGKVLKEAAGDVQEAIDMTYYIAAEGTTIAWSYHAF